MLLSVSRTIIMIFLRYKINKKLLVTACIAFSAFLMTWEIMILTVSVSRPGIEYGYSGGTCWRDVRLNPLALIDHILRAIFIGFPPVIATICFVIVSHKMLQKSLVSRKNGKKRQATVTMAMFTMLFLVCNLPCLLNNVTWFVSMLLG